MIEIKLEKSTLPKNNQKVKWQTNEDFDNKTWKEGTYSDDGQVFIYGYDEVSNIFDSAFSVLHWQPIKQLS